MIRLVRAGNWSESDVGVDRIASTRRVVPEVESAVESAWKAALARPGVNLFDGPMCRLESWTATESRLKLLISPTRYKLFLGTHMTHPEFAETFGSDVMPNPIGVSPALLTSDHQLLLGRRSDSVAYYSGRVHPFAGSMEPEDASPFAAIRRELQEELALESTDIADLRCVGIAEDKQLVQPELIFSVRSLLTRTQIESRLDPVEHQSVWSIPATADGIASAIGPAAPLTPIAVATLLFWGRIQLGQRWFDEIAASDRFR